MTNRSNALPYPLTPYPKVIINAALTGMVPTKKDTPHVPVSVDEIVSDAIKCCRAGASIVHLHARDASGAPTYRKDIYAQIIRGIRQVCPDLIICVSTSGRVFTEFDQRAEVLQLDGDAKPDMASLTLGSLNFPSQASINAPDMVEKLALKMKEQGIMPELEIFDTGMISTTKILLKKGVFSNPCYCNILLGSMYAGQATISDAAYFVQMLPDDFIWSMAGIGIFQLKMNIASMIMGGGVRVGIEDSIYYDANKTQLATNEAFVQRIVRIAGEIGRDIATPIETRRLLGLTT